MEALTLALSAIGKLTALATAADATYQDAEKAWNLIQNLASKNPTQITEADLDPIEAHSEELEARGLKPIAPPED